MSFGSIERLAAGVGRREPGTSALAGYGAGVVLSTRFGELDEAPLARSPIVSVVWQLRFEDHPALATPQAVLRLQELLGGALAG